MKSVVITAALFAGAVSIAGAAEDTRSERADAVFVMTNDATRNEVIAYDRTSYGTLFSPQHFATGGRGSGGKIDPLASQGSLTLSQDGNWLFAVNAGSGTVSVFRVFGSRLLLSDQAPTDGSEPTAVTQHGNLVYVLNSAASSSVVGYRFVGGHLIQLPKSDAFLSANLANPGAIAFSPDGRFLVVTEKASSSIDVFPVLGDGTLGTLVNNKNAGPGTFSATFAPNGIALVAETGVAGATNASAVSSYSVQANGTLTPISVSVPTLGAASCWIEVTPNGRFVYIANAGTSSIAGFSIGSNGALTAVPGTIAGLNPAGSTNIDIAISSDGKYLYSVNTAKGAIGQFAIDPATGHLTSLGTVGGLPAGSSLNGIAAN